MAAKNSAPLPAQIAETHTQRFQRWLSRRPSRFATRDNALAAILPAGVWVRWEDARDSLAAARLAERWSARAPIGDLIATEPCATRMAVDELLADALNRGVLTLREVPRPEQMGQWGLVAGRFGVALRGDWNKLLGAT